jgi:hypothetical protein
LTIKKILIGFLAACGAVSIVALCGYFALGALSSGAMVKPFSHSFPSPDGKYKAVLLTYAGGSALGDAFCYDKILIVPASISDEIPNARYEVYSANCDIFDDHTPSPKLVWTADSTLEIAFSINSTALFGRNVFVKKTDDSKQVVVRYLTKE